MCSVYSSLITTDRSAARETTVAAWASRLISFPRIWDEVSLHFGADLNSAVGAGFSYAEEHVARPSVPGFQPVRSLDVDEIAIQETPGAGGAGAVQTAVGDAEAFAFGGVDDRLPLGYLNGRLSTVAPLEGDSMHLLPDVAGAVAAGPANLVGAGRATRGVAEVDEEVLVEFHPSLVGVDVRFHHQRPLLADFGVELVVP